jgi:hypothetical protein
VLEIGTIPGAAGSTAGRNLALRCLTCDLVGISNESVTWGSGSHKRSQAGVITRPDTFNATFFETKGSLTLLALRQWHEQCRGTKTGNAHADGVKGYAVKATLSVFDDSGNLSYATDIINMRIQNIETVQLDQTPGNVQQFIVNSAFAYDRDEPHGVELL